MVGTSPFTLTTSLVSSVKDTTCILVSIKISSKEDAEGSSSEDSGLFRYSWTFTFFLSVRLRVTLCSASELVEDLSRLHL